MIDILTQDLSLIQNHTKHFMEVLNSKQIDQKIKRISYEILEHNFDEKKLFIVGINSNGLRFAQIIKNQLSTIFKNEIILGNISLNPAHPNKNEISIDLDSKVLHQASIIIVDDVANTGRTVFYAYKALIDKLLKKVEVAVLVDRKHKSFPVAVKYLGLSLATTVKENIVVDLSKEGKYKVVLE